MTELTSRERMLRAFSLQEADHIPCCFMSFSALRKRHNENRFEVVKAQLGMGLDAMPFIPTASRGERPEHPDLRGLPVRFNPQVRVREWRDPDSPGVLHKEVLTPGGKLTTSVRLSDDWPHGEHIPFVDDYQVPRALEPLVTGPGDLDVLQYLLVPPDEEDVLRFGQEAHRARQFAEQHGVLLAGGWGAGMDMANWLCGMEDLMVLTLQEPGFVADLLDLIHEWNKFRMRVVLSASVDLYIRRAWYEGCDFCTPQFYRDAVLPRLKAEVDLAHEHGARFGYICSSGMLPMLSAYLEAGIDVLIGIDPIQGTYTDMPRMKQVLGSKVCLWGGVSGAVTVEQGTEQEVRSAVAHAIDVLGPTTWPDLGAEISDMAGICEGKIWAMDDPLGLGGIVSDAYRLAQLIADENLKQTDLLEVLLDASLLGLESFTRESTLRLPVHHRLAFRELGLSIGLRAVERLQGLIEEYPGIFGGYPRLHVRIETLMRYAPLIGEIETFWLKDANRRASSWTAHRDIHMVMLATSLAPDGYLAL